MSIATLGPAIGKAYVPGYGTGTVFASEKKDFMTVQIDKTGIRHYVARERIQWRKK